MSIPKEKAIVLQATFQTTFLNKLFVFWLKVQYAPIGSIENKSALIQVMAGRQTGDSATSRDLKQWYWQRYATIWRHIPNGLIKEPVPWFNIKMSSYQYRKSHCGGKMVVRSSYLDNGISYTGKMTSLYWTRAQWSSKYSAVPIVTRSVISILLTLGRTKHPI